MDPKPSSASLPPSGSPPPESWWRSLWTGFKQQAAAWFLTAVFGLAAVFSGQLAEHIKVHLQMAESRVKNYEEIAKDLSSFAFNAELIQEFMEHNWTKKQTLTALINDYNAS